MGLFDQFRNIIFGTSNTEAEDSYGGPDRRFEARINPREGTRILIVDDSPTIAAVLKRFLDSSGCYCMEAPDAKAGLELALTQKPELIFLDIVMPGINGFAALRALRRNPRTKEIPVIMMSGNEQATAQFFGANIGADDFMKKPFSRDEVFSRIERLLDEHGVPRRLYDEEGNIPPIAAGVSSIPPVPSASLSIPTLHQPVFQPPPQTTPSWEQSAPLQFTPPPQFIHSPSVPPTPQSVVPPPQVAQPEVLQPPPQPQQPPVAPWALQPEAPQEAVSPAQDVTPETAGTIDFDLSIFDVDLRSASVPQAPPPDDSDSAIPFDLGIQPPDVTSHAAPPVQKSAPPMQGTPPVSAPPQLSIVPPIVPPSVTPAPVTPPPITQLSQSELLGRIAVVAQQAQTNPAFLVELSALTAQLVAISSPQPKLQQTVSYLPTEEDEDPPHLSIVQE